MSELTHLQRQRVDQFCRPPVGWYLVIEPGLVALAVLASSKRAYEAARGRVPLPSRGAIQATAIGTALVHLAEAAAAYRAARRRGLHRSAPRWAAEAFLVGFPALLQLHRAGGVTGPPSVSGSPEGGSR
ncbi:MAG: DUF4499 domain-containing protein [Acidimicrobiales bacterium]|nr:DUF4499 domain-containing protein [Acidimicrobiales bacterium]